MAAAAAVPKIHGIAKRGVPVRPSDLDANDSGVLDLPHSVTTPVGRLRRVNQGLLAMERLLDAALDGPQPPGKASVPAHQRHIGFASSLTAPEPYREHQRARAQQLAAAARRPGHHAAHTPTDGDGVPLVPASYWFRSVLEPSALARAEALASDSGPPRLAPPSSFPGVFVAADDAATPSDLPPPTKQHARKTAVPRRPSAPAPTSPERAKAPKKKESTHVPAPTGGSHAAPPKPERSSSQPRASTSPPHAAVVARPAWNKSSRVDGSPQPAARRESASPHATAAAPLPRGASPQPAAAPVAKKPVRIGGNVWSRMQGNANDYVAHQRHSDPTVARVHAAYEASHQHAAAPSRSERSSVGKRPATAPGAAERLAVGARSPGHVAASAALTEGEKPSRPSVTRNGPAAKPAGTTERRHKTLVNTKARDLDPHHEVDEGEAAAADRSPQPRRPLYAPKPKAVVAAPTPAAAATKPPAAKVAKKSTTPEQRVHIPSAMAARNDPSLRSGDIRRQFNERQKALLERQSASPTASLSPEKAAPTPDPVPAKPKSKPAAAQESPARPSVEPPEDDTAADQPRRPPPSVGRLNLDGVAQ